MKLETSPFYLQFQIFGRTVIFRKKPNFYTPQIIQKGKFCDVYQYFYFGGRLETQQMTRTEEQKLALDKLYEDDEES